MTDAQWKAEHDAKVRAAVERMTRRSIREDDAG